MMIIHILKMAWNSRRKWAGIFIEQCLVFIVLAFLLANLLETLRKYREPGMLDTRDMVLFSVLPSGRQSIDKNDIAVARIQVDAFLDKMREDPNISGISESMQFIPYLRSDDYYRTDSIAIADGKKICAYIKSADREAFSIFKPKLVEGEWFSSDHLEDGSAPAIITRQFATLAGWSAPFLGRKIRPSNYMATELITVIGVLDGLKQEVLSPPVAAVIVPVSVFYYSSYREFAIRVKPGREHEVYSALHNRFKQEVPDCKLDLTLGEMNDMKKIWTVGNSINLTLQTIPSIFLLIFAFMGAFGLFWLNSQRRIREFGLRRAIGSTKGELARLVIVESLVVTLAASLPGIIISCFIFDLTPIKLAAMFATLVIMLIFAVTSAWYPAYKASKINPAQALKNE